MPLLQFARGNPMTLTVVVGQALRDGMKTKTQIEDFVEKLRNGEVAFKDEASEGRSKSLGASLSYGFEQAFTEDERKVLALLHFFQGFVDVDTLRIMGDEKAEWCLLEVRGLTREAGIAILDKASEIGLLTSLVGGYYTIHPALPWFFKTLFDQYYSPLPIPQGTNDGMENNEWANQPAVIRATHAFVESMGTLSSYYHDQYEHGNRDVIAPLRLEESNLLHARSLARQNGWWDYIIRAMEGLDTLYDHTGRHAEWKRLVNEIVPDFVDKDGNPITEREEKWLFISQWMRSLFREQHDYRAAENQIRKEVEFNRRRATTLLSRPAESLSAREKNSLRSLGTSLHELGEIQREMDQPDCAKSYQEAFEIMHRIGDVSAAAAAMNLGHTYKDLPALRNLDEAERWYHRILELCNKDDRLAQGKGTYCLGHVNYERFKDAKKEEKAEEELLKHLNAAMNYYKQALALLPLDAVDDLAVTHHQLGNIYSEAGNLESALYHYNQDVHYDERAGNQYGAGGTRFNIALMFAKNGRLSDALLYARAALRNFESYGGKAKEDEDQTKGLIAQIEKMINQKSSNQ